MPPQVCTCAAEAHTKELSKRQAAKEFRIPESTLRHYLKKLANMQMGYVQHRKMFTDKMENDLAQHCINVVRASRAVPRKDKAIIF